MNPAAFTRLEQLEQEWQQRLLMQPSNTQADIKKAGTTPPQLSPLPDPEVVSK